MRIDLNAIRHGHNAVVEAVQRAQARAVHVGELLRAIRATMDPFNWCQWLDRNCPIDKSTAHRYLNEARMRRKAGEAPGGSDRIRRQKGGGKR